LKTGCNFTDRFQIRKLDSTNHPEKIATQNSRERDMRDAKLAALFFGVRQPGCFLRDATVDSKVGADSRNPVPVLQTYYKEIKEVLGVDRE
jgi:hypothetical protein